VGNPANAKGPTADDPYSRSPGKRSVTRQRERLPVPGHGARHDEQDAAQPDGGLPRDASQTATYASDRTWAPRFRCLRYQSQLRHIYIGRAHKGQTIRLLIAEPNVRIVGDDGQLLRELTLDPSRRYFGAPTPVHNVVRQVSSMSW